ncbi:hypothetical protein KI387_013634, partial [Taxus chinensis]
ARELRAPEIMQRQIVAVPEAEEKLEAIKATDFWTPLPEHRLIYLPLVPIPIEAIEAGEKVVEIDEDLNLTIQGLTSSRNFHS